MSDFLLLLSVLGVLDAIRNTVIAMLAISVFLWFIKRS